MALSNIQFIVQSLPVTAEQFHDKLRAKSETRRFYATSPSNSSSVLQPLQQCTIRQCCVESNYVAFLLEDGRVCRVKYVAHSSDQKNEDHNEQLISRKFAVADGERPPKISRNSSSPWISSRTTFSDPLNPALKRWGTHMGVIRSMETSLPGGSSSTASGTPSSRNRGKNILDPTGSVSSTAGVRLIRTSQLRGRGPASTLLGGHRAIVSASHVPEELINQVQGILQGKSRNIIVRELQRTNLDVNLAVNNLLSRDDEDNDDGDDNGSDYMPGEDLLSLLDSGIHPAEHGVFIDSEIIPEELIGYTTLHRASRASQRSSILANESSSGSTRDTSADRDPIIRLKGQRFFEPLCSYESEQEDSSQPQRSVSSTKETTDTEQSMSVSLGEELEWWMEDGKFVEFMQIGAMHSELCAVDKSGTLRQWQWSDNLPYRHPTRSDIFHPRTLNLNIQDEKIVSLATCSLRSSVLVEMGGVATWIDESVANAAEMLEHPVTGCVDLDLIMEFGSTKHLATMTKCLHVCPLYTATFTNAGISWWGVPPFHLRKKILEKDQLRFTKESMQDKSSLSQEIVVGSLVCLKPRPMFHPGAIAINMYGAKPKIGCLQEPAWNLTDSRLFKVLRYRDKRAKGNVEEDKNKLKATQSSSGVSHSGRETVEAKVIQSNSERETVLKSTSALKDPVSHDNTENEKSQLQLSKQEKKKFSENDTGKCLEKPICDERWRMQDVIFVEDVKTVPVGEVIKVDGDIVAVVFKKPRTPFDKKIKKRQSEKVRLLLKSDVLVVDPTVLPKVPGCIVRSPRKILLNHNMKLHSIYAGESGIEVIGGGFDGQPLVLATIDMLGKVVSNAFPTPSELFFESNQDPGDQTDVCRIDKGCQNSVTIFRDRNSCLYPIVKNESGGIRDPTFLNLTPLTAVSTCIYTPGQGKESEAKMLSVTAMVFKSYHLMPHIIHRDHSAALDLLDSASPEKVQMICGEVCDGMRNIVHMAASLTAPSCSKNTADTDGAFTKERKRKLDKNKTPLTEHQISKSSCSSMPLDWTINRSSAAATEIASSSFAMSQTQRMNAVNAIANAVSVVTKRESEDSRAPGSRSSPASSPSSFRPRLMRDIMQQFAAVWDEQPNRSSQPNTSSSTVPSSATSQASPAIVRVPASLDADEPMEHSSSVSRSSFPHAIPTTTWPPASYFPSILDDGLHMPAEKGDNVIELTANKTPSLKRKRSSSPSSIKCTKERGSISDGLLLIKGLLSSKILKPNLYDLMCQRDIFGHTPFMSAVYERAYPAAVEIFQHIQSIARERSSEINPGNSSDGNSDTQFNELLMTMTFPSGSDPDANPLYVLCVNDTCSFTWTGAQHINQDIYECWTCGLTGTLCCCSECARVCHNGHDCKLKRTSPTAYCDCWEKCACRSLVAGDNSARGELLCMLLEDTCLVNLPNSRGETILLFLAQTVARQTVEQRQYRNRGLSAGKSSRSLVNVAELKNGDTPPHNLQPPSFCKEAFLQLLHDWKSVRATINCNGPMDPFYADSAEKESIHLLPDEEQCLLSQTGTSYLDSFTLCLLVKCSVMYLDILLQTLVSEMQNPASSSDQNDDLNVVHKFVRSLVRIFVVLSSCSGPDGSSTKSLSRSLSNAQPLKRIQRAFNSLLPVAVKELGQMAIALLDPVRLGIAKPTSAFASLSNPADILRSCETAFSSPPKRVSKRARRTTNVHKAQRLPSNGRNHRTGVSAGRSLLQPSSNILSHLSSDHNRVGQIGEDPLDAVQEYHSGSTLLNSQSHHDDSLAAESTVSNDQQASDDENISQEIWENDGNENPDNEVDSSAVSNLESGNPNQPEQLSLSPMEQSDIIGLPRSIGEGDLDVEDEDEGKRDDFPHDEQDDEESDMDLTLLAGSEVDSDVEQDTDAGSDQEEAPDQTVVNHSLIFLEDDERNTDGVVEDENTIQDDEDDDERHTYTKTSEDEAATNTDLEDDNMTSHGEDEEPDGSELQSDLDWVELPLERGTPNSRSAGDTSTSHSMTWALGGWSGQPSHSLPSSAIGRSSGSSVGNLIYIDSLSLRRGTSAAPVTQDRLENMNKQSVTVSKSSTSTTNSELARAFGICVREIAKLLSYAWQGDQEVNTPPHTYLEVTCEDAVALKRIIEDTFSESWRWLLTIIDSNEAQLRYGETLSYVRNVAEQTDSAYAESDKRNTKMSSTFERKQATTKTSYPKGLRDLVTDSNSARQDFLSYLLSLMRAHSGEHSDFLPVLDVSALRHVAYVLDAMIYYLRQTSSIKDKKENLVQRISEDSSTLPSMTCSAKETMDKDDKDVDEFTQESMTLPDELYSLAVGDVLAGDSIFNAQEEVDCCSLYAHPQKTYFRRSDSMTFLGCTGADDSFSEPLVKALPLADKPHLLHPNSRKEDLFGRSHQQNLAAADASYFDPDLPGCGMGLLKHKVNAKFEKLANLQKEEWRKVEFAKNVATQTECEDAAIDKTDNSQLECEDKEMKSDDGPSSAAPGGSMAAVERPTNPIKEKNGSVEQKIDTFKPSRTRLLSPPTIDSLINRSRLTLELFSKVFLNDVGMEHNSIFQELGGFAVREAKFRKEMERLRNSQTIDLQLNVARERQHLVAQTFKQLNQHYRRRTTATTHSAISQPLAVQRVKVVFKDEPGEGSGVARSFYTSLCEALLSSDKLPPLDSVLVPLGPSSRRSLIPRMRKRELLRLGRSGGKKVNLRSYFLERYTQQSASSSSRPVPMSTMSTHIPPFYPRDHSARHEEISSVAVGWSLYKRAIGDRLLPKIKALNPKWAEKITGMLLSLRIADLLLLLSSENMLRIKVNEASRRLAQAQYGEDNESQEQSEDFEKFGESPPTVSKNLATSSGVDKSDKKGKKKNPDSDSDQGADDEEVDVSTFPLFYQPGKRGFYSPVSGPNPKRQPSMPSSNDLSNMPMGYEARMNAFRNVGRIIGLCLLQNELCPLPLNRHVLKFLLGRKISWQDFAFFDPVLYESMRFMLHECESSSNDEMLQGLEFTFVAEAPLEEGGGEVELLPGGSSIAVTPSNVHEYIWRYTSYRMIACCFKALSQMREGLFDVLPKTSLDGLTAEDLRLLVNGCGRVDVRTLVSYTSFNDESGKSVDNSAEKLSEFKLWFWTAVERMNHAARQELLYFWTGSPALPASEDGFQPLPTVTIRPPDDHHLPTANTCISRLYVPLYSSRAILKRKLMMAIKTKNFGFV